MPAYYILYIFYCLKYIIGYRIVYSTLAHNKYIGSLEINSKQNHLLKLLVLLPFVQCAHPTGNPILHPHQSSHSKYFVPKSITNSQTSAIPVSMTHILNLAGFGSAIVGTELQD